jgi:adenylate cyclase
VAGGRRLSAVAFTDLEGYTSLSNRDEPAALRLLEEQDRLVGPILERHHGTRVKSIGDGMLLEFPNARDAVDFAIQFQHVAAERNLGATGPPLTLRIGIHLGDVEQKGADILGDAVNIASRIEPLSEPGGVCVSRQVFDQVRNKLAVRFESLGARTLRGVSEPVEIFRVVTDRNDPIAAPPTSALPRLAVLPLANFSADSNDAFFADGLTEELIALLSQVREIRVIARTSVFQYKGTTKTVNQIGRELSVSTVLEGSVRKSGDQLRVTVQLIDAASQEHLWASTYDRTLNDILAVQSEIAKRITKALKLRLSKSEEERLNGTPAVLTDSYLAYVRGRFLLSQGFNESDLRAAQHEFETAIALDPKNARAYSGLSDALHALGWGDYLGPRENWLPVCRAHAKRALSLDPNLA